MILLVTLDFYSKNTSLELSVDRHLLSIFILWNFQLGWKKILSRRSFKGAKTEHTSPQSTMTTSSVGRSFPPFGTSSDVEVSER